VSKTIIVHVVCPECGRHIRPATQMECMNAVDGRMPDRDGLLAECGCNTDPETGEITE
jgi:hypothetical protein